MKITQITSGRFHHFHLARQLEIHELLDKIYTGYPKFKLKDETGIPISKIKTFPWLHAPFMKRGMLKLDNIEWLNKKWAWLDHELLDTYVASNIQNATILIALSGSGLKSGKKVQRLGGKYICDRGSSHIRFQDKILTEEYDRWGLKFKRVDKKMIEKEEEEYSQSNFITVPSDFVKESFINQGVSVDKIIKIPYGARLDRFNKIGNPALGKFRVLWVGGVTIRKGFLYALAAFKNLNYEHKEFIVIGSISDEIKSLGVIPNQKLIEYYSSSHVFVLPSIEEGLAMVQGEALACGCPIIATPNSGSNDLFTNGKEGFIIPIRSADALTDKLQFLVDNPDIREKMSEAALLRVKELGGWDTYGLQMCKFLKGLL